MKREPDSDHRVIAIVIPAKNEERNIRRCLEAVEALDYDHNLMTLHVVDNGSTDGTAEVAREFGARVHYRPGGTIASVRNWGAKNSEGEVLAFLDADCVVAPNWIREGLIELEKEAVAAVGFVAARPPEDATWVERGWHHLSSTGGLSGRSEVGWLSSFNLIVKRKCFDAVGGFDERLVTCEDVDFSKRLAAGFKLILSDRSPVCHLGGVKTLTQFWAKEKWRGIGAALSAVPRPDTKILSVSTVVPVLYWFLTVAVIPMCFAGWVWGVSSTGIVIVLAIAFSLYKAKLKGLTISTIVPLTVLSAVYLHARGTAILQSSIGRGSGGRMSHTGSCR